MEDNFTFILCSMVLISGHAPAKLAFVAVLSSSCASLAFTKNRRAHIAPSFSTIRIKFCLAFIYTFLFFKTMSFLTKSHCPVISTIRIKFLFGFCLRHPFPKRLLSLRNHIALKSVPYCIEFLFGIRPSFPLFRYNYYLYPVQRNLFFTIPPLFFRIETLQRTFFSIEIRTVENRKS